MNKSARNKVICLVSIFIFLHVLAASARDERGKLTINELQVLPSGQIWCITGHEGICSTDNIQSDWRWNNSIRKYDPSVETTILRFFDSNIGLIFRSTFRSPKPTFHRTTDSGTSWHAIEFNNKEGVRDVFVNKDGHAWAMCIRGGLFYSDDFGLTWSVRNALQDEYGRTPVICMRNVNEGIIALETEMYSTFDNWHTCTKIETACDQDLYTPIGPRSDWDEYVKDVGLWKDLIVIKQGRQVYYSNSAFIEWKPFEIGLIAFEIDHTSNHLIGITEDLRILSFSNPSKFRLFNKTPLNAIPSELFFASGSLFVVDKIYNLYQINSKSFKKTKIYTNDKKIDKPRTIKQVDTFFVGATETELYLSKNEKTGWYREASFDFHIQDILVMDKTNFLLWDGKKNNYRYSLDKHKLNEYRYAKPLDNFLTSPIQTLTIKSGSKGCFHSFEDTLEYRRVDAHTLGTDDVTHGSFIDGEKYKVEGYSNIISAKMLHDILVRFSTEPDKQPSIEEFAIDANDINNYKALVASQKDHHELENIDLEFYYSVPDKLASLDPAVLNRVLDRREEGWCTTSTWFTITFINDDGNELNIFRRFYIDNFPWYLSWDCTYKDYHFNCYGLELSKFINDSLPDKFSGKEMFDNKFLIMEIANDLFRTYAKTHGRNNKSINNSGPP